jgi:hypothetical protein
METSKILFVVKRDRLDLYDDLKRSFAGETAVEVVLDRRHRERRRESRPPRVEHRANERRIRTVSRTLESNSFAVVRRLPARGPRLVA